MLEGLKITPLKVIKDERGMVKRMIRADDDAFLTFGEIYFSTVNYNVIKGWKRHKEMTLNIAVPVGDVRFVIYDDREDSSTKGEFFDIIIGDNNYSLLTIPPMVWVAFCGLTKPYSMLANCASIMHDPDEADNLPIDNDYIDFSGW